jgi:hypothetical protein
VEQAGKQARIRSFFSPFTALLFLPSSSTSSRNNYRTFFTWSPPEPPELPKPPPKPPKPPEPPKPPTLLPRRPRTNFFPPRENCSFLATLAGTRFVETRPTPRNDDGGGGKKKLVVCSYGRGGWLRGGNS